MLKFIKGQLEDTWKWVLRSFWAFFGYAVSLAGLQAMNILSGFIIIRALTKDDYAEFTIINTLGPVLLLLSDNGIRTGVSAIGRKIWQDDEKMGRLVNTGLGLRRRFALVSFIVVGPLLAWMLFRHHAPIALIVLLTAVTLTGVFFQLTTAVMSMVVSLRQQLKVTARVGLARTILRLGLIAGFAAFSHLTAFWATLAGTCSLILEASLLVRAVKPQISWSAAPDPEYRKSIFSLVRKTLPLTVYYCVQGQISIWLISIFGNSHQVADIGAAGRLGLIFSSLTYFFSSIVVPRFARNNGRQRLFVQFGQIVIGLSLMLAALILFTWLFPAPFILLLGSKYANMSGLLWLVVLSSGVNSLSGLIYSLNTSKGWIPPAILTIPVEILTQIVLLLNLNLGKTESVLIFSSLSSIPVTILSASILIRRIKLEAP